ncbi:MAG: acyltransferase, partial [Succinivibrio sp.]|nr:acyltransferase [Succinivibrio sp.]
MKDIRHDIDGLKAIAILAVVFYHLFDLLKSAHFTESTLFDGGFLGVDIFFVISGFLITSSVFYKLSNNDFSLLAFYKRRCLRILPPLLFVCIFTLVIGYFLLFPEVYKELNIEVANALLFIGNFRLANSGGYFALTSSDKPLLHTWYLAVTIQFYILFPLIVLLLK